MTQADLNPATDDHPVIVVADSHAQRALVERLLDSCDRAGLLDDHRLVFLGDYVDRGPDARGLIDICIDLQRAGHVMLMGNHELVLTQALTAATGRDTWLERWQRNYEDEVLASYDVPKTWDARADADALLGAMPQAHVDFLQGLPWLYENDSVIAIHAGVDHDRAWTEQRADLARRHTTNPRGPEQLCLKPYGYDERPGPEGKTLVTGHSTRSQPFVAPGRAMIDCGAEEGRLCAWVSDTGEVLTVGR